MPITPEAEAIKRAVRAPIQDWRPVGYQRNFLDGYRPNVTWYLPAETRQRLLETERLLELGEAAEGKDAREAQMILNHKAPSSCSSTRQTKSGSTATPS